MTLASVLASSRERADWIDKSTDGLEVPSTVRARLSAACFDQVHEHHKAIRLLLQHSLTGSAFSLVRPTFETFVRGLWLLHCATDTEVEQFTNDKLHKSFDQIIEEIEARDAYNVGVLSRVKKDYWNSMCSYAHGGYLQAVRRNTEDSITANYTEGEAIEVANSASTFALLAAFEVFTMANRDDLAAEVFERIGNC